MPSRILTPITSLELFSSSRIAEIGLSLVVVLFHNAENPLKDELSLRSEKGLFPGP